MNVTRHAPLNNCHNGIAIGHADYCTAVCPCNHGEGDCDNVEECGVNLVCEDDVGPMFGFAAGIDVCVNWVGS
jgi:hypothetical protein